MLWHARHIPPATVSSDPDSAPLATAAPIGRGAPGAGAGALDRPARFAARLLDAPIAFVLLAPPGAAPVYGSVGVEAPPARLADAGLMPWPAAAREAGIAEAVFVADVGATPPPAPWAPLADVLGAVAVACVPVPGAGGAVRGMVAVGDRRPRVWSAEERALLGDLAEEAAAELDRREQVLRGRAQEAALAAREARVQTLLAHAADAISVLDARGMVRFGSPSFRRLFGYGESDRAGQSAFEFIHPDDLPAVHAAFARLLARPGGSEEIEARYRHGDGSWRNLVVTATNLLDDATVGGVVLNIRDVTTRRQAEAALRASEARFRAFVEQASDVLLVLDAAMTFRYISPQLQSALGHDPAAFVGTNALSLVHPEDVAHAEAALTRALQSPEHAARAEVRVRHADGSWRAMEAVGRVFAGEEGGTEAIPSGVLVNLRDTTARREAEQALRASEERFRSLSVSSPMGIFQSDLHGRTIYANPRLCEIAGVATVDALLGEAWLDYVHPDDRASLVTGWRRALVANEEYAHEYRLVLADGALRWVYGRSAPVHDAEGRVIGSVGTVEDVTERRALREELERQAQTDPLTGLANRTIFARQLERALARAGGRRREGIAVLFLDLDDFKTVNDTLGHAAGDLLLRQVTERLLNATRGSDLVARLGGDEFAVLLENVRDLEDVVVVAERIVQAVRAPFLLDGREARVGASVGIARGTEAADADELLRNADHAMYRAKQGGKARHAIFSAELHASALDRRALSAELPGAVERGEFTLVYQPVVALGSGHVAGVEALVRWRHPERGLLLPDTFIALAEETGAIVPLGRWVLRTACLAAAAWPPAEPAPDAPRPSAPGAPGAPEATFGGAELSLSVNVSARQLEDPGFVDEVAAALRDAGLDGRRLVLEITEGVLVEHGDETVRRLAALKALGVRLAVDDFGTGYSSLSYLHRFPVDVLKVDRAFVAGAARGGRDAALARTILALGESLGLGMVAEGVETAEQEARLRTLGCEHAQGYFFSRPLTPEVLAPLLERRRTHPSPLPALAEPEPRAPPGA